MFSRSEIDERLKDDDLSWDELEALETAKQLAEWLDKLAENTTHPESRWLDGEDEHT
jgi:hypothetical protein